MRLALLARHLAERGHELHIALLPKPKGEVRDFLDGLAAEFPHLTYGSAPRRRQSDGWGHVARLVRGIADLARWADPRMQSFPLLRNGMTDDVRNLLAPQQFDPITRRIAAVAVKRLSTTSSPRIARRVIRVASRLESAIPTSGEVDRYLRERAPDVVVSASVMKNCSEEVELLKSARRLGIPTAVCVASWDKLTTKGLLKFVPERVFVWNGKQVQESVELHGIPRERVVETGAYPFDDWFERRATRTREEYARDVGLDPGRPYLLYLCSSNQTTRRREVDFVLSWIEALRDSGGQALRGLGIAIRPHPDFAGDWRNVDLSTFENVVLCKTEHPVAEDARADFFDGLVNCAAAVGINTTAMIEAAIAQKSVLTVVSDAFAQEATLHFHYMLAENGGFLHVATSLEEHVEQLGGVLEEDSAGAERRRGFVESFIRPCGINRPAAPIMAEAFDELARLSPDRPPRASALRPLLVPFVWLNALQQRRPASGKQVPKKEAGVRGTASA